MSQHVDNHLPQDASAAGGQTKSAASALQRTAAPNDSTRSYTVNRQASLRKRPTPPSLSNQQLKPSPSSSSPPLPSSSSPPLPARNFGPSGRPRRVSGKEGIDKAFDELKAAASRDAIRELHVARSRSKEVVRSNSVKAPPQTKAPELPSPRLPQNMASTSRPNWHDGRTSGVQRTTSVESSISTAHSFRANASHSHSASQDSTALPDTSSLIAAAGSAEAAIHKLLLEKQSVSAQNAQLWRMVEKQRAMILGFTKDLERAQKDKERYRKKLKDNLVQSASTASLPGASQRISAVSERENSQSPAFSEALEESAEAQMRIDSVPQSRKNSDTSDGPALLDPLRAEPSMHAYKLPGPSPLATPHFQFIEPSIEAESRKAPKSPALRPPTLPATLASKVAPQSENTVLIGATTIPNSTSPPPSSPYMHTSSPPQSPRTPHQMPSPKAFSSPKDRFNQASRKAPPAPLNLAQSRPEAQDTAIVDASDSDYEDEITPGMMRRGRRKTREEDDREREEMAIKEQESRSKSKKDKKSKSKAPGEQRSTPENDDTNDGAAYLSDASSPPGSPGQPQVAQVQTYQSLNSLTSMVRTPTEVSIPAAAKRTLVAPSVLSPGLPMSPRPGDRPLGSPMPRAVKVVQSATGIPMSPSAGGLPLSPRAPRQPIPLPPQTPLSISSPHLARAESYHKQAHSTSIADRLAPNASLSFEQDRALIMNTPRTPGDIYRGLVSDQYPDLLLPPNALPSIYVKVDSSRLRPSRHSYIASKQHEDNLVFTLAVYARSDNAQIWRVEKTLVALAALDQQLKASSEFRTKLPDRGLFTGHAPARMDARRSALSAYFEKMLDTPMDEKAGSLVCSFFSTDAIAAEGTDYFSASQTAIGSLEVPVPKPRLRKDGYLTKRGKNFGGWKARYFVLDGPTLKYFEAPGGAQLGSIKLQNAQIGKQSQSTSQQSDEDADNQYRHAFLILEPKRKDSSSLVRHVLCAEDDEERDAWVESLLQYVESKPQEEPAKRVAASNSVISATKSPRLQKSMGDLNRPTSHGTDSSRSGNDSLRSVAYNNTVAAEAPVIGPGTLPSTNTPSPPITTSEAEDNYSVGHPAISAPSNAQVIQDAGSWGNKSFSAAPAPTPGKDKKRSIFGFRGRSSSDIQSGHQSKDSSSQVHSGPTCSGRRVFGASLAEAVEFAPPLDVPAHLPGVVYRCIEYLTAKNAASEEGIFRLSGSNIVIKALRERFDAEGDVNLVTDGQYYDVHAVASLLKLYLRELPATILTRELHLEFLKCLDVAEEQAKIEAFNVLVNRLPRANRELLDALSSYLREIVDNETVNKMTVRNGMFIGFKKRFARYRTDASNSWHCLFTHTQHPSSFNFSFRY